MIRILIATSILFLSQAARAQTASSALPDGPGKALVQKACSKCHSITGIVRARNSAETWAEIVDDMLSRGAEASDEEVEQIIGYLAKNFGKDKPPAVLPKIAINKIAPAELADALNVSVDSAKAITDYREKNGPFKTLQDLAKVPDINMSRIEREKDRLDFSEK